MHGQAACDSSKWDGSPALKMLERAGLDAECREDKKLNDAIKMIARSRYSMKRRVAGGSSAQLAVAAVAQAERERKKAIKRGDEEKKKIPPNSRQEKRAPGA